MLFNAWTKILEKIREEKGLSRERAAGRAGVATITWYRWESGLAIPGPQQFEGMAKGLGLSAEELGFRYSEHMFRHYESRLAASDCLPSTEASEATHDLAPQLETASPTNPTRSDTLRGVSPGQGEVWVNLGEVIKAIDQRQRAALPNTRPKRRDPMQMPRAIRRKPKRKR